MGTVVLVVVVGVVVVVVVVLSGEVGVVVPLVAATCGSVVALGDAVLGATGSIDVDLDPGAGATAPLVRVGELGDESFEEGGDADDDPRIGNGAPAMPEESALPPVDVSGVVDTLDMAVGALGEPGSSPKYAKIATMPKTPAIPIPFCRCRILNWYLNSLG
ncbi:MAG TPA: hypothetical protein VNG12_10555 [Acidimicrobiales bacterium]|nr:hypothetical protein [Acidimicrobiales bacterium]